MNEVTKIHLGRQAFTISVDAHHELRSYLDAIKKQVGDKEVVEEIELRMAELLGEHGIDTNKVILSKDVDFLKEQLGNPKDFSEEDQTESTQPSGESKKLFRDTENAIIAGVSAGLSEYFGLDVLLIRILFILFTIITAGWAILLYIVLWILVPEAKTSSDRLLMAGKPVTVDSLKDIVERADVKGAVTRANATLVSPINTLFRFILKIIGLIFVVFGLSALFGLVATETYILINNKTIIQNNIFPIGLREHLLVDIVISVLGLIAIFILLFGIAIFRRKWPIRNWVTGILIGLLFIGIAIGGALSADVYPTVRARYNVNTHTTIRTSEAFNSVSINGGNNVGVNFVQSNKYFISFNYYGNPNLTTIYSNVVNKTLIVDTTQFNPNRDCSSICIPNSYNMTITIYSPNANELFNQYNGISTIEPPSPVNPPKFMNQ